MCSTIIIAIATDLPTLGYQITAVHQIRESPKFSLVQEEKYTILLVSKLKNVITLSIFRLETNFKHSKKAILISKGVIIIGSTINLGYRKNKRVDTLI